MLSVVSGLEHFEEVSNSCSRGCVVKNWGSFKLSGRQPFLAPKTGFVKEQIFMDQGMEEWFQMSSDTLYLLCTLFLLLHCDIMKLLYNSPNSDQIIRH